MTMQHRRSDFNGLDLTGYVSLPKNGGGEVLLRKQSLSKRDHAANDMAIRIDHLSMASRAVVERISVDEGLVPNWYCLRVMTGREFAVEKILDDAGVMSLVVRTNPYRIVRRGRIREINPHPVIAGYVLVFCHPIPAAIMGLSRVDHVLDVVGGAISPWRADAESIHRFMKMAEEGKYDHREKAKHSFMLEEHVRVADGPFASFVGPVVEIDDDSYRVKVEVNIFGRSTPVDLDIAQIEKL